MATFTNLDQEKLAEADKHELRKANTLGSDKSVVEEPFGNSEIVLRADIFSETPTANTAFAAPAYGEWPLGYDYDPAFGAVASRRTKLRLHPLTTSGMTGPSSIQTFVIVSSTPASDDPVDIEAVRIKHLVPPDLSPGRTNASDLDPNFRGFELALFPSYSAVDDQLDAYDGYGAIPITADPTAVNGMGADARWTVDYANGIVRFTDAPLNGLTGVMNPFNVYGTIDGQETTVSAGGRVTMFATFYQYTGPSLTDSDNVGAVTVGDGMNSFGTYYGPTSTVMQAAIDSLSPYGGTVYLKEGDYTYTTDVEIPENVNVVGLSKRAIVIRPPNVPAFTLHGSNTSLRGVTVRNVDSGATQTVRRADVEISTHSASQTVENVRIEGNTLWASHDAYGVGFAPEHMNATYKNINIEGNVFDSPSFGQPVFIGESYNDANVTLENVYIHKNDFTVPTASVDGYAVYFPGKNIEDIRELHITDNHVKGNADIGIDVGQILENVYLANNSEFRNLHLSGMSGSIIKNNVANDVYLDGYIADSQFNENILHRFNLTESVSDFMFSGNTCLGKASFKADAIDMSSSGRSISNVSITGNKFHEDLAICDNIDASGSHIIDNLVIENNKIDMALSLVTAPMSLVSDVTFNNLRVRGNIIGSTVNTTAISCGEVDGNTNSSFRVYLNGAFISGNTLYGHAIFSDNVELLSTSDGMKFSNNGFDSVDRGLSMGSHVLNNLVIENNTVHTIELFEDANIAATDVSGESVSNIVIKNNVMHNNDAMIKLFPLLSATSSFTLTNLVIDDNEFDGTTASIIIMDTASAADRYVFSDIFVTDNTLPHTSSYIKMCDSTPIGTTTNLVVSGNNVGNTVTISTNSITDLRFTNNTIIGLITIAPDVVNMVWSGNDTQQNVFSDAISEGAFTGNSVNSSVSFLSTIENMTISGNVVTNSLSVAGTTTTSSITGNTLGAGLDLATVLSSNIGSNFVTTNIDLGATTKTTISNNSVSYRLIVGAMVDSTISGGFVSDNATITSMNKSTMMGVTVTGNLTVSSTLIDSVVTGNQVQGSTGLSLGSTIATTNLSDNVVANSISITSTATESIINGNRSLDITLGGALTDCSFSNNQATSGVTASTFVRTAATGNTFKSSTSNVSAWTSSNLTDSTFTGNTFLSLGSGAGVQITFGSLTDSVFSDNSLEQTDSSYAITFGAILSSQMAACVFTGKLDIDSMNKSTLSNSYVTDAFTINKADNLMYLSSITDCNFLLTVAFGVTGSSVAHAFDTSSFTNNTVGNVFTLTTYTGQCLLNSKVTGNHFSQTVDIKRAAISSTGSIMTGSAFDNNYVGNILTINYIAASTASQLFEDCTFVGNQLASAVNLGQNGATTGIVIQDTAFTSNVCSSNLTIGNVSRSHIDSSYLGMTFCDNSFEGAVSIYGRLSGSTMSQNTIGNNVTVGQIYGSEFIGNVIGSDGTGALTLGGGLASSANFIGNTVNGAFAVSVGISSSNINNNAFLSTFDMSAAVLNSLINDNNLTGATTFATGATFTESSFSGNHSAEHVTFADAVSASVVSGNVLDSAKNFIFSSTGSITGSTVNDNIGNILTFAGGCTSTTISGNAMAIYLTDASLKDNLTITGNSSSFDISSGDLQDSVIVGNHFYDFVVTTTAMSDVVISGNYTDQPVSFGPVSRCNINNNIFDNTLTFGDTVVGTSYVGNNNADTVQFASTCQTSTITANTTTTMLEFVGKLTDTEVSSNHCDILRLPAECDDMIISNNFCGSIDTGSATGALAYTRMAMTGNTCVGTCILKVYMYRCAITGNIFQSTFEIETTTTYLMRESSMTGNVVGGTLYLDQNVSGNYCLYRSSVTGNSIVGSLDIDSSGYTLYRSIVSDNTVEGEIRIETTGNSYYAILESAVTGNRVDDSFVIDNVTTSSYPHVAQESVISDNVVDSNFYIGINKLTTNTQYILNYCTVTGNDATGVMRFGHTSRDGDIQSFNDSVISNNRSSSYFRMNGKSSECNINGNNSSSSYILLGALNGCTVADNRTPSHMYAGYNAATNPVIQRTTFSGNFVQGNFEAPNAGIHFCTFAGNKFEATFNVTSQAIKYCTVTGNQFAGVAIGRFDNVVWQGNRHTGSMIVSYSGFDGGLGTIAAGGPSTATQLTFQGNLCESTVIFDTAGYGASAGQHVVIYESTYTGNVFLGQVTFGDAVTHHEYYNMVFSNNTGPGGVQFKTDYDDHFANIQIIGNAMSGTLTSDIAITSPQVGSEAIMIALNSFGGYSGITFDDSVAIGWGDNKVSAGGHANYPVGSNMYNEL